MNIKALRLFRQIVIQGSLASAARELHISQPAASRLITQLEAEIHITLFHRSRRRLLLTDDGERFFREAEHIVAGLDEIPKITSNIRDRREQQFRVLAAARVGQGIVSPALVRMRRLHPEMQIHVDLYSRRQLEKRLGVGIYDLGVISLPVAHSLLKIEAVPLVKVRAEAIMSADHPLAAKAYVTAEDLANQPMLGLVPGQVWRDHVDNFLKAGGVDVDHIVQSSSSLLTCQMARDGAGIAVLDRLCAPSIDMAGAVMRPLYPERWLSFGYVYGERTGLSSTSKEFVDCMRDAIESIRAQSPVDSEAIIPLHTSAE
ncbi:LysR family transcriptional regulator [Salinicola corii]|uniref:LysR family transcriptional regulator n=1 Tax=Salinicola corii TaxID=2606937 RepID=A0A640WEX8_9GAMM|nr:LysR family transcriptional regulator [Salinicola corii]KAA0018710.1 LysR family transcriptional regulator [Salinicola corii]